MPTLAGIQGSSLVPNTAPLANQLINFFQQRNAKEAQGQQQQRVSGLSEQALTGDDLALANLTQADPKVGRAVSAMLERNNEEELFQAQEKLEGVARDAFVIKDLPPEERKRGLTSLAQQRIQKGQEIDDLAKMMAMSDDQLDIELNRAIAVATPFQELLKSRLGTQKSGIKGFAPKIIVNEKTGERRLALPTLNPNTGQVAVKTPDLPKGFKLEKLSPFEKSQLQISTAAETVTAKGAAKRGQEVITLGLDAAQGLPILNRSLELLDIVKTGGLANISLSVRQKFGLEGANEGELSANLGKSVLKQLKPTFGAAFTAEEGKELKSIEASFTKSPATNRRLLNKLRQLALRAAKRAIREATKQEDFQTAAEIQELIDFRFEEETTPAGKGQIMIDANGNRAEVFPDGTIKELL